MGCCASSTTVKPANHIAGTSVVNVVDTEKRPDMMCGVQCCLKGPDGQSTERVPPKPQSGETQPMEMLGVVPKENSEATVVMETSPNPIKVNGEQSVPPLTIWEHVRDAVRLWGDRGGGNCQPQPLFDAISCLLTVDTVAQQLCGFHQASVHIGANAKVARTLVPFVESEVQNELSPPGTLSLSARTPNNEVGLKERLEQFLKGNILIKDPELLNAIHAQDVDWADVDNGAAVLSLASCLKQSGAKHVLHTFVSERRFSAEFAATVIHKDDKGSPIMTEVMTDEKGAPILGLQFRVTTTEDLSSFEVKPSIIPYVKEMDFERGIHNEQDMQQLANFECAILKTQLRRAGMGDTVVCRSGTFETAGLSGNVHKLTWYLYDHDGSVRRPDEYRQDADEYFHSGVGNSQARRKLFQDYTNVKRGLIGEAPQPSTIENFFEYCRKYPQDKIVVHCGGPLFLLRALAKQADLRERVILVGAMFLSYDGEANLLGMNFNEGVARGLTEELFGADGKQIHQSFPKARLLCVTTETCKSPGFVFIPFADTLPPERAMTRRVSENTSGPPTDRPFIPEKKKNQPLLIISDDGKDPDDELAKVLLSSLTRRGLAKCYGFISNLHPAKERARLARGTLDQLGMESIPVGVGENMVSTTHGEYEFNAGYMGALENCKENGVELFVEILQGLEKGTTATLVCLSGLADAWRLLRDHRELFLHKDWSCRHHGGRRRRRR